MNITLINEKEEVILVKYEKGDSNKLKNEEYIFTRIDDGEVITPHQMFHRLSFFSDKVFKRGVTHLYTILIFGGNKKASFVVQDSIYGEYELLLTLKNDNKTIIMTNLRSAVSSEFFASIKDLFLIMIRNVFRDDLDNNDMKKQYEENEDKEWVRLRNRKEWSKYHKYANSPKYIKDSINLLKLYFTINIRNNRDFFIQKIKGGFIISKENIKIKIIQSKDRKNILLFKNDELLSENRYLSLNTIFNALSLKYNKHYNKENI